jgi:hypothetical protein
MKRVQVFEQQFQQRCPSTKRERENVSRGQRFSSRGEPKKKKAERKYRSSYFNDIQWLMKYI